MGRLSLPEIDFRSRLSAGACSRYSHASMRRPAADLRHAMVVVLPACGQRGSSRLGTLPLDVFEGHGDRQAL